MKLNKTQCIFLCDFYNNNTPYKLIKGTRNKNTALGLSNDYPELFICQRLDHFEYSFTIKDLGYLPNFFKLKGY